MNLIVLLVSFVLLSACTRADEVSRCLDVRTSPYRTQVHQMPVTMDDGYTALISPCSGPSVNFGLATRLDQTDADVLHSLALKSRIRTLEGDKTSVVLVGGEVEVRPFNEREGYQIVLTKIDTAQITRRHM